MKVALVTGTRPQIIKSSILIRKLTDEESIDLEFIHTGQHYDNNLFMDFIREFDLFHPFNITTMDNFSYSPTTTMKRLVRLWGNEKAKPDLVIVPGDTDSAFAAAYAANLMNIPVVHLESGVREYDMTMREERNRRLIDHSASLLCVPTQDGWSNLVREHVMGELLFCGDTNYDLFMERRKIFCSQEMSNFTEEMCGAVGDYGVLTIHREANTNIDTLRSILDQVDSFGRKMICPMHPRTKKLLDQMGDVAAKWKNFTFLSPVPYDTMMNLIGRAKIVVTDSGGLQKEAYFINTPCVTLRDVTAWTETVEYGGNVLVGTKNIKEGMEQQFGEKLNNPKVFGDGTASQQIVSYLRRVPVKIPKR